ncbi:MAG TPA: tetratricopeptide repeat protein [Caulobacteraceae bacterium]|nr:tetratricopeptide repeat protein [Caulobacteraceae bacterium]
MNRQQRRAAERKGGAPDVAGAAQSALLDPTFAQAARLHQAGRLAEAEQALRVHLLAHPRHAEGLHLLGLIQLQSARPGDAIEPLRKAIAADGRQAQFHNNLGSALRAVGRIDEAIAAFRKAVALRPDYPRGLFNLGRTLTDQGASTEGAGHLRRAIALAPQDVEALWTLAAVAQRDGDLDQAADLYERALKIRPASVEMLENLAKVRVAQERGGEAIAILRRLIELQPHSAERRRILAGFLVYVPDLGGALDLLREAIRLEPQSGAGYDGLANALADLGHLDEAMAAYREAVRLSPDDHDAYSNMIMTLHSLPGVSAADILEDSRRYAARAETAPETRFSPGDDPERRLRVGYVSADFRIHPVGFFLEGVLAAHDPQKVEVRLYSDTVAPDEQTERLRAAAHGWTSIRGMSDEDARRTIQADGVDVLIDLAGHTGDNRLPMFAARAAPVQASWLGYFGTTGLSRMDYVIADDVVIAPGEEGLFSETPVRLPSPYLSWTPPREPIPLAPPPMLNNGFVTFGCFNNPRKISAPAIAAWAEILRQVEGSRLLLKYWTFADPLCRTNFTEAFARYDVGPERLMFEGLSPRAEALAAYNRIDIALDPFPFGGCTTTADTLWMGVPVLTLHGQRWSGRMSRMILSCVGLDDWAAPDVAAYVETAVRRSRDPQGLTDLRAILRGRMAASAFCDGPRLARHLEDAYRAMWRRWCAAARPEPEAQVGFRSLHT